MSFLAVVLKNLMVVLGMPEKSRTRSWHAIELVAERPINQSLSSHTSRPEGSMIRICYVDCGRAQEMKHIAKGLIVVLEVRDQIRPTACLLIGMEISRKN